MAPSFCDLGRVLVIRLRSDVKLMILIKEMSVENTYRSFCYQIWWSSMDVSLSLS